MYSPKIRKNITMLQPDKQIQVETQIPVITPIYLPPAYLSICPSRHMQNNKNIYILEGKHIHSYIELPLNFR